MDTLTMVLLAPFYVMAVTSTGTAMAYLLLYFVDVAGLTAFSPRGLNHAAGQI